ncbi:restriction endonuclease subunit S [Aliarcobacter butzleri]|uniref:restriction endonuclease subunit S n=1 Tax=Aliarcobacter butzleri TaxID=28197 RepID=UPI0032082611
MSSWKECKLGDVAFFQRGHDLPKSQMNDGLIPVAGSNGVIGFHDKSTTKAPGITIGRSGNIGTPKFYNQDFWAHNTVLYVKDFKGNDEKFVFYFLNTIDLSGFNSGSAVPTLNRNHIHEIDVKIPPLEEQKAIAEVLSSLDDKIDLLHRQNQTLESLAQTLFRQWFIEEAKEEWEEKPLGDIAVVQNGYAFSSKDYVEFESGYLEVFKMGHIEPGGGLRFSPKADFVPGEKKLEKWTLNEDDIVMAMTDMKDSMGILGHPAMIDKSNKYVLNQRVARIYLENQNNLLNNYLLYLQLSSREAIESLQSLANGGVQVNLSTEAIKSVSIIVPPKEFQKEKANFFDEYLQKMKNNRQEIQTLENLRDTLLSKLLSGEVRIKV